MSVCRTDFPVAESLEDVFACLIVCVWCAHVCAWRERERGDLDAWAALESGPWIQRCPRRSRRLAEAIRLDVVAAEVELGNFSHVPDIIALERVGADAVDVSWSH